MSYWIVEAIRLPHPGNPAEEGIRATVEWNGELPGVDELSDEQARWFGAGMLRGMGYSVRDVRVVGSG